MLPLVVFVSLPAQVAPADAETLLRACNQAYLDGECRAGASAPADAMAAEVTWRSETLAVVTVDFSTEDGPTQMSRRVTFQPVDDSRERHRTLGFVVGSLAGAANELLQEEAPASGASKQTEPKASPAAQTQPSQDKAGAAKPESEQPKPAEPTPAERRAFTADARRAARAQRRVRLRARNEAFDDDYRFGVIMGSGVDTNRYGLGVGARGVWSDRWLLDVVVSYAAQQTNELGVGGNYLNLALGFGVEAPLGPIAIDVSAGPAVQWQWIERSEVQRRVNLPVGGADGAIGLRYTNWVLAPFFELRGGLYYGTEIRLEEGPRNFGPWQYQALLGIVVLGNASTTPADASSTSEQPKPITQRPR